jgi:UDP-N-acetylglucosamine--N-acetylmuramyl-(pentapeptide) pyrophosphoryl-undecaprenol N-acetylglucosamine transferase
MSFGGYLALPVVICAWLLDIPVLTHEQTPVPGLANKIIAKFAKKVLTGIPLRKEILNLRPVKTSGIFVTGGNQGSHVINQASKDLFKKYKVVIQTGDSKNHDYEELLKLNKHTYKFLNALEMAKALNEANLVISRAGANICAELAYLGKPAILIPIPWSSGNEQMLNAKWLNDAGVAEILEQKDLNGKNLLKLADFMFKNLKKYQHVIKVETDAARKIVEKINHYA